MQVDHRAIVFGIWVAVILFGGVSYVSASVSIFSISLVAFVVATILIAILSLIRLRPSEYCIPLFGYRGESVKKQMLVFVICVAPAIVAVVFPYYNLNGFNDSGGYLAVAANISHTGSAAMEATLYNIPNRNDLSHIVLDFPGFEGSDEYKYTRLLPALAAVLFTLGGVDLAQNFNALIAPLVLYTFFILCRSISNYWPSFFALVLLAFNPAFMYSAKILMPEMLMLGLCLVGLLLAQSAIRESDKKIGVIAGLVFALASYNRPDGILIFVALAGFAVQAATMGEAQLRACQWLIRCSAAFAFVALAIFHLESPTFASNLWLQGYGSLAAAMLLVFAVSELFIYACLRFGNSSMRICIRFCHHGVFLLGCIVLIYLVFGHYIRPLLFNPDMPLILKNHPNYWHRASLDLALYLPEALLALLVFTFFFIGSKQSSVLILPFAILFVAGLVLYTFKPGVLPLHPWMSRRWIYFSIPMALLLLSHSLTLVERQSFLRKLCLPFLLFITATFMVRGYQVMSEWVFVKLGDRRIAYELMVGKISELTGPRGVILTDSIYTGLILRHIYAAPVALTSLSSIEALIGAKNVDVTEVQLPPICAEELKMQPGFRLGELTKVEWCMQGNYWLVASPRN